MSVRDQLKPRINRGGNSEDEDSEPDFAPYRCPVAGQRPVKFAVRQHNMRQIWTWIIALLYVLFGAMLSFAMPRFKMIVNDLNQGRSIEYSFSSLCLLNSPSWAWLPLCALCAWGILVFGTRGKGPWRNILLGTPLCIATVFWLLTINSLLLPWIVTIDSVGGK